MLRRWRQLSNGAAAWYSSGRCSKIIQAVIAGSLSFREPPTVSRLRARFPSPGQAPSLVPCPLDLDADGAARSDRSRLFHPHKHSLHSWLCQPNPSDVRRECLDREPPGTLGVSPYFIGHHLIVYAVGNIVGCAGSAEVSEQVQD